ncbi:unnamed protein product [Triticum turgidum subsp. durum]|uniref:Uncharacterized protein n=1 Tax=Triticum turgidum subsp. durum TaxID=4567 RepID=A0A9R0VXV5_TRITD|nr:unnamed protein product [Triticum turgidum subsp. durum]
MKRILMKEKRFPNIFLFFLMMNQVTKIRWRWLAGDEEDNLVMRYSGGGIGNGGGSIWMSRTSHWMESKWDDVLRSSTAAARDAVWYGLGISRMGSLRKAPPRQYAL